MPVVLVRVCPRMRARVVGSTFGCEERFHRIGHSARCAIALLDIRCIPSRCYAYRLTEPEASRWFREQYGITVLDS